jgi:hypothetical protein
MQIAWALPTLPISLIRAVAVEHLMRLLPASAA